MQPTMRQIRLYFSFLLLCRKELCDFFPIIAARCRRIEENKRKRAKKMYASDDDDENTIAVYLFQCFSLLNQYEIKSYNLIGRKPYEEYFKA